MFLEERRILGLRLYDELAVDAAWLRVDDEVEFGMGRAEDGLGLVAADGGRASANAP